MGRCRDGNDGDDDDDDGDDDDYDDDDGDDDPARFVLMLPLHHVGSAT